VVVARDGCQGRSVWWRTTRFAETEKELDRMRSTGRRIARLLSQTCRSTWCRRRMAAGEGCR